MPSPLLHSAVGAGLARPGSSRTNRLVVLASLVVAANAADFDLIPGLLMGNGALYHHGIAHSLGAAVVAGGVAAAAARPLRVPAGRFGLLVGLAFASHLVFDMLAVGKGVHNAVPFFWPLTSQGFTLPIALFPDIVYDPRTANFLGSLVSWHNAYALLIEMVAIGAMYATVEIRRAARSKRLRRELGRSGDPTAPATQRADEF